MSVYDLFALAISAGALVVAVISLKRQARQAGLTELQIAEHEERQTERVFKQVSEQLLRNISGPRVKEFTEEFANMSLEEQEALLRQADELNDPDKSR